MPLYEYVCEFCGSVEERLVLGSEKAPNSFFCVCGGAMDRKVSAPNIRFAMGCSFKDGYDKNIGKMNFKSDIQKEG